MLFRDLLNKSKIAIELVPASISAASTNGNSIDRQGFGAVEFIVSFGALAGTYDGTNFLTITLQESADNSTWTAVTDQNVIGNGSSNPMADIANGVWIKCNSGTIRDAIKSKANRLDYRGSKRYVRLVFALAGTPVATLMGSEAILFDPAQAGDTNMLPSISTGNDNG